MYCNITKNASVQFKTGNERMSLNHDHKKASNYSFFYKNAENSNTKWFKQWQVFVKNAEGHAYLNVYMLATCH